MKEPLKVGDWVRTYGRPPEGDFPYISPNVGTVVGLHPKQVCVQIDGTAGVDEPYFFERQQVRRLVKKKRRSVWINPRYLEDPVNPFALLGEQVGSRTPVDGFIEFREVKP
jgi:hypothetical protein